MQNNNLINVVYKIPCSIFPKSYSSETCSTIKKTKTAALQEAIEILQNHDNWNRDAGLRIPEIHKPFLCKKNENYLFIFRFLCKKIKIIYLFFAFYVK